ncbi:uncharacterized protein PFL1_03430 [Pseudozyma flocculosa PF-1]|uniref:RecF/RecN/SMC N-terminal domain-containing protein n=1 Tax=Pseudozyma flocculosa PF-1 TaxID=1277687 RepID=A0A061H936_9BASI|nr:uncharacterized protein PFL1_03430 [Pseudozyma flocculosa PF-1]EPQ29143.1 hypothetical protein PFL1_03430 [Pseudozyma flocculosa PF-1]
MSILGKRVSDSGAEAHASAASKRARSSHVPTAAYSGDDDDGQQAHEDEAGEERLDLLSQLTADASQRGGRSASAIVAERGNDRDVQIALAALARAEQEPQTADEEQERLDMEAFEREDQEAHSMSELKAGAIERVELTNFMCHENFAIDLGPRLNIVIGQNGSGKSAILTAMTIALGAKASSTNRASNLRTLVKHGSAQATVRITLSNAGDEAFKPHLYGNRIIIERRIKAEGPATWKLQDRSGKTVETTSAELHAICDQFSLQMDNPINVLTQDNARQFLGTNDPKKLYTLYFDGTQLSTLSKEVEIIKVNLTKMATQLAQQARARDRLKDNLKEAERQWDRVQAARGYQTKIDDLKNEMAWALVAESKESLEQAMIKIDKAREDRDKYASALSKTEEELDQVGDQITSLEAEEQQRAEKQAPLLQEGKELKQRIAAKRMEQEAERQKEKELARQQRFLRGEIDELQAKIDVEADKLNIDGRRRRDVLEERQLELKDRLKEIEDERVRVQREADELEKQRVNVHGPLRRAEADRDQMRQRFEMFDGHLRSLQGNQHESVIAFGGVNVPKLLQQIDRDRNWRVKPVGPLGRHLKVKDMKWAPVLESVIGNTLNAFFVTCHQDRSRLERYIRQLSLHKTMVLTGSDELFDFSQGEPSPEVLTILRVLEFDNEVVKRQLVTQVRIERSALVETRRDGDQLMRRRPHNVQNCYSGDLYQIRGGDVGSASIALNKYDGVPRFSQSQKDQIARVQHDRKEAEAQLLRALEELEKLVAERSKLDRQIDEMRKKVLPGLNRQADMHRRDIERIDAELAEAESVNLRAFTESKQESERAMADNVDLFKAVQASKQAIEDELRALEEQLEGIRSKLEGFKRATSTLSERMLKATERRVKLVNNQDYFRKKVEAAEAKLEEAKAEEAERASELDAIVAEAQQLSEEVETDRSADEISREIDATREMQRRSSREAGISLEQAQRELEEAKERRDKGEEQYRLMTSLHAILQRASLKRWDKINEFKRSTASRTKHLFTKHLQKRGYSGSLHFDHGAKTLGMSIRTNDRGRGSKMGDPKALSGGEKSYTTTSLLLSLWQAIKSPIRCLDEFDVFMDTFNRKIALDLLMGETMAYRNVQYVLITPLELPGNVNVDQDGVMVHKLAEPERGQNVLMG